MNLGIENKKKALWASILGGLALLFLIWQLSSFFSTSAPPPQPAAPVVKTLSTTDTHAPAAAPMPAAAPAAGKAAEPVAYSAAQLDPTLHMEGMLEAESLLYGGTGRNIFSKESAPPPVPRAIAPARPLAAAAATGPVLPPPPPPPPPIDLKFFGVEIKKDGGKRAFLLHGEDVFLAGPGDIVDRRYKIDSILPNGIVIEDLPNNNTQTVPLTQ